MCASRKNCQIKLSRDFLLCAKSKRNIFLQVQIPNALGVYCTFQTIQNRKRRPELRGPDATPSRRLVQAPATKGFLVCSEIVSWFYSTAIHSTRSVRRDPDVRKWLRATAIYLRRYITGDGAYSRDAAAGGSYSRGGEGEDARCRLHTEPRLRQGNCVKTNHLRVRQENRQRIVGRGGRGSDGTRG